MRFYKKAKLFTKDYDMSKNKGISIENKLDSIFEGFRRSIIKWMLAFSLAQLAVMLLLIG